MGLFHRQGKPKLSPYVVAQVAGHKVVCQCCGGKVYQQQNLKMETTATELFGAALADLCVALICCACGSIQQFTYAAFTGATVEVTRVPYKEGAEELQLPEG